MVPNKMRIYAVADIHGKTEKVEKIKDVISQEAPDILVIAGDITNYVSPLKTFDQLKGTPIPIMGIRGNSDFKRVEGLLRKQKNTTLLNHVPVIYKDADFAGLSGTIPLPFLSKISFRETHFLDRLKPSITPDTILVVHPPPRGVCDKVGNRFSAGSIGLRNFIENHPPLMVLCGHIHEQAGYQFLKNTLVVNCAMNKNSGGAIIDSCKNMPLKVKMIQT
ncbi:MAG: phosphoesterase [Desulfobacula sp.]|nr:phosphoesterase [Desulfobacula sp.]